MCFYCCKFTLFFYNPVIPSGFYWFVILYFLQSCHPFGILLVCNPVFSTILSFLGDLLVYYFMFSTILTALWDLFVCYFTFSLQSMQTQPRRGVKIVAQNDMPFFKPRRGDIINLTIQTNIFHHIQFQICGENQCILL